MYRVIIVEDDFRIAEINKSFVEQVKGFRVVGVSLNGRSFLQLLKQNNPDLVLLDVYIPDISGEELLLYLRKNHPKTDVIMITAAKEVKTLEFFLKNGIFDYVVKPVHADRLHRSLKKYKWYKEKLAQEEELDQKDIDELMDKSIQHIDSNDKYPKGIDSITLERVKSFFTREVKDFTAEEAGKELGISRSTARRYLDYLVQEGTVIAELRYGTVGRPERIYRLL